MNETEKDFSDIVQDIKILIEEKGFQFKPIRDKKFESGMKEETFRVEKKNLSIIISIRQAEKLPPT